MLDVLRFCAWGCCHFANNRAVTKSDYELALRAHELDFNLSTPVETVIPCRRVKGRLQFAVEGALGFYFGLQLPQATGVPVRRDENFLVFDCATGDFLRVATDEDIRTWNVAHRQLSSIVRDVRHGIPSLLHIPIREPKS